jgi:hypothetical protein
MQSPLLLNLSKNHFMKLLSLLCFLATSPFVANKIDPTNNIDPEQKNIAVKAPQSKPVVSISGVWVVEKLHHVVFGKYSAYERNKSNNTDIPYDNLQFTFYENGTGMHTDQFKKTYPFQWRFTSPDQQSLELTVNGTTYNWDMLSITDKYLYSSVHLNIGGNTDNVETFRLVKVGAAITEESSFSTNTVKSKTQILADNTWIVEEVKSNVRGNNLHYRKGRNNSTGEDYSIYSLTFNVDGTGTYTDGLGYTHQTAWRFTSADEHNMQLNLDSGGSYDWSMVEISENSFQSITELNIDGHDLMQSTRYVPQKSKCGKVDPALVSRR